MDYGDYFRFLFALIFVIALIAILALVARRAGFGYPAALNKAPNVRRLELVETASVDGRRRLVLVRRDNVEHLLIIGQNTETVIETMIKPAQHERTLYSPVKDFKNTGDEDRFNDTNE
jgi:flagellar protein FliO/FliZ